MSGAEALAVLGIIANVTAVLDFSSKATNRIKECLEDAGGLPELYRKLQVLLPLMSNALRNTEQQAQAGELDASACTAIQAATEDCGKKLEDLNSILDKMVPAEGTSRWKRGLKAINSLRQDKKVEEMVNVLNNYISTFTYLHISAGPTSTQITSLLAELSFATSRGPLAPASTRKSYYIVPLQWSDDFTGRDEILKTLDSKLC